MEGEQRVRLMMEADINQICELEKKCFSEPWSFNLIRSGVGSPVDTYFVYEARGEILGYSVMRILADEGEIQRIAVLPAYRRQGIARKLMDAMMISARRRGARAMALEVRESNLGARRLYISYGFKQEAVRRGYYHNPAEDAVIMWNRRI